MGLERADDHEQPDDERVERVEGPAQPPDVLGDEHPGEAGGHGHQQVRVVAQRRRDLAEHHVADDAAAEPHHEREHGHAEDVEVVALVAAGPTNAPPCPAPKPTAARSIHSGAARARPWPASEADRRAAASRPCRPGARTRRCARPASRRPRSRPAVTTAPTASSRRSVSCRRRRPARGAPLVDRQVHDRGGEAERDRQPPHRVVGAGRLVDRAAEPDADERADLVARGRRSRTASRRGGCRTSAPPARRSAARSRATAGRARRRTASTLNVEVGSSTNSRNAIAREK